MFKDKDVKKENTYKLKLITALEEEVKAKDEVIKLTKKIIELQDINIIYQTELIENYKIDIAKLKFKLRKKK